MFGSFKVLLVVFNILELNIDLKYGEFEKMKSKIRILKINVCFFVDYNFLLCEKIDFKGNIRFLDFWIVSYICR